MFAPKRHLILAIVLALALGSLSIMTVSASERDSTHTQLRQETGTAWLGVAIRDSRQGVTIESVESGSPADDAGLRSGDIITAVDGTEITSAEELVETIQSYAPGDEVTLTILRRQQEREITVTLGEKPEDETGFQVESEPILEGTLELMGLRASKTDEGLLIEEIDPDSSFAEVDLQAGDVITAIDGESVNDMGPGDLMRAVAGHKEITFTVQRDGEEIEVVVESPMAFDHQEYMFGSQAGSRMQLGVTFLTLTSEIAVEHDLATDEGALITEVYDDSPAAEAGLQVDDVITAVDGDAVDQEHTLRDRLVAYEEDDVVTLTVQRGGETLDIEVTLGPSEWGWGYGQGFAFPGNEHYGGMMYCFPFGQGEFEGMMPFFFGHGQQGMMPFNGPFEFDFTFPPEQDQPESDSVPDAPAA